MTTAPQTANPLPVDWKERLARTFYRLKTADAALQIEKDTRRQIITENAIKNAYRLTGNQEAAPWPEALADDMAIHVGDQTTIQNPPPSSPLPGLAKLAATAALGAGLGLPAGFVALDYVRSFLAGDSPPAVSSPDTDTQYDFGLGFPDAK